MPTFEIFYRDWNEYFGWFWEVVEGLTRILEDGVLYCDMVRVHPWVELEPREAVKEFVSRYLSLGFNDDKPTCTKT